MNVRGEFECATSHCHSSPQLWVWNHSSYSIYRMPRLILMREVLFYAIKLFGFAEVNLPYNRLHSISVKIMEVIRNSKLTSSSVKCSLPIDLLSASISSPLPALLDSSFSFRCFSLSIYSSLATSLFKCSYYFLSPSIIILIRKDYPLHVTLSPYCCFM